MIPVNGIELEVFEAGREHAGRPIVLCHGWPEHAKVIAEGRPLGPGVPHGRGAVARAHAGGTAVASCRAAEW